VVVTMTRAEAEQLQWAEISVQDRGVGIPEADLPLVFDRYHRGTNVVGSTIGEGIGLASARQLVEWHGGRLTVVSTEGQGSTFTMWIPVAQPLAGETA
jgi:signal transduction histidine kinase